MLPLFRKDFPSSKDELTRALDEALRRFVQKSDPIVHLRARVFPYVDEIAINLDGAQFDSPPPPWADAEGETKVAFEAAVVTVSGRKISVRGVPMDFRMKARDVVFHKGKDATGEALLLVQKARDGQVSISAAQVDLEEA